MAFLRKNPSSTDPFQLAPRSQEDLNPSLDYFPPQTGPLGLDLDLGLKNSCPRAGVFLCHYSNRLIICVSAELQ